MGSTTANTGRASPPEGDDAVEEVVARAWLKAHAHDPLVAGASIPQDYARDHETGETVSASPSGWLSHTGWKTTEGGRQHRPVTSIHAFDGSVELWQNLQLHWGNYVPTVGRGGRTRRELDTRVRLDRALSELREDQVDVLRRRYFEDQTLEAIAEELASSKQAVHKRLRNAEQDLLVAIAVTWNLPYDLAEELLGIRLHEGRPPRDREGERRAAELAIVAARQEADR